MLHRVVRNASSPPNTKEKPAQVQSVVISPTTLEEAGAQLRLMQMEIMCLAIGSIVKDYPAIQVKFTS